MLNTFEMENYILPTPLRIWQKMYANPKVSISAVYINSKEELSIIDTHVFAFI